MVMADHIKGKGCTVNARIAPSEARSGALAEAEPTDSPKTSTGATVVVTINNGHLVSGDVTTLPLSVQLWLAERQ